MNTKNKNRNQSGKRIRWIARIWSLPVIGYALLMGVGYGWSWATTGVADPYAVEDVTFLESLPPILLFLAVMGLGVAWRWERLGGLIALLFLLGTVVTMIVQGQFSGDLDRALIPLLLVLIVAVPGVLFLVLDSRAAGKPSS